MKRAALLAVLGILLAGCGGSGDPEDSTDLDALDSGNYPTQPTPARSPTAFGDTVFREGRRLAAHVPLPHEADPQLRFGRGWPGQLSTATRKPGTTVWPGKLVAEVPGFIVGWATEGQRRLESTYGRSLRQQVLRFDSAAAAAHAARILPEGRLAEAGALPLTVPGHPAARGAWKPGENQRSGSYSAWLAHGSLLLFAHVFDPLSVPPDPAASAAQLGRALTRQTEYLTGYQPTPVAEIGALPADTDGMLARTLPRDGKPEPRDDPPGVYGIRAAAAYAYDPPETADALRNAGVDLIAISGATIARARSRAAARELVARFSARFPEDLASAPAPAGLPGAECRTQLEKGSGSRSLLPRYVCYLSHGRYFAMVSGNNQQDTHQRAAAQYKILANGK